MGRGQRGVLDNKEFKIENYRYQVFLQATRVAELGKWPEYIDVQESLVSRVPSENIKAAGFDAGIACALDLIPRDKQKLSASLHAAYTPSVVEQVRQEVKHLTENSETAWWLAACSVCTEGKLTPNNFYQQIIDFTRLADFEEERLQAAQSEYNRMSHLFEVKNGIAFGTEDGAMQGAYIAGHDIAAMYDSTSSLYFIGTFLESLDLEDFSWSDITDERGLPCSGPVHGSKQFVKAANKEEYHRVLEFLNLR